MFELWCVAPTVSRLYRRLLTGERFKFIFRPRFMEYGAAGQSRKEGCDLESMGVLPLQGEGLVDRPSSQGAALG